MFSNFQISTLALATATILPLGLHEMHEKDGGRLSLTNFGSRVKSELGEKKVAVSFPSAVRARRGSYGLMEIALSVHLLTS